MSQIPVIDVSSEDRFSIGHVKIPCESPYGIIEKPTASLEFCGRTFHIVDKDEEIWIDIETGEIVKFQFHFIEKNEPATAESGVAGVSQICYTVTPQACSRGFVQRKMAEVREAMNNDQVLSLARSLLKIVGAVLVMLGMSSDDATQISSLTMDAIGSIMTVVGLVMSWRKHGADPASPSSSRTLTMLIAFGLAATWCGVASAADGAISINLDELTASIDKKWLVVIVGVALFLADKNKVLSPIVSPIIGILRKIGFLGPPKPGESQTDLSLDDILAQLVTILKQTSDPVARDRISSTIMSVAADANGNAKGVASGTGK